MEFAEEQIMEQDAIKRITDLERMVAELSATTAPVAKMGEIQIALGQISSRAEVSTEEIKNLRKKQENDMEKSLKAANDAANSNKPDYKIMLSAFGLVLALMGALTGYVSTADSDIKGGTQKAIADLRDQLTIDNTMLLTEINEAKSSASSAGKKAAPVMDDLTAYKKEIRMKIEELQQRVPSQSEWAKADATIESLRAQKIAIRERITQSEGKIERSLLLIEKTEEAWKAEVAAISTDNQKQTEAELKLVEDMSKVKAALSGAVNELEAQCRGTSAYINSAFASIRQQQAALYESINGKSLPDIEYFSDNICASAVVNIGKVNGN